MLEELIKILGWQGGTKHQALDEVKRLVAEKKYHSMDCGGCIHNPTKRQYGTPCHRCNRDYNDEYIS